MLASSSRCIKQVINRHGCRATSATRSTNVGRSSFASSQRAFSSSSNDDDRTVVIVNGCRLPFSLSSTLYNDELAVDLQQMAISGLLTQNGLVPKEAIDYVICGNVVQEVRTTNIAREALINAGLPVTTGGHTISQACISANAAICNGAERILAGKSSVIIAGGVETFSDAPIRLSRKIRQKLIGAPKVMKKKGAIGALRHVLGGLKLKDYMMPLEIPAISNYTTGEVMGVSSDRLSAKFGISRADQDEYTVNSHLNAAKAHTDKWYDDEIVPYKGTKEENGIKADTSIEAVSKLKPAFVKPHGTHTAANSSFLTDGAAMTLLMSLSKAKELGVKPMAYLRDWTFTACDPFNELLLGPTYNTQQLMARNPDINLETDVGVFEIHEAFAGQILSNLTAMSSQKFADDKFNGNIVGKIPMDKLNIKGGSLSIGHPFGATGSRLVTAAAKRLQHEQERYALVSACADGGMGHSCLLERYDE